MGRIRQRRNQGWVTVEKRSSPQRWVAHWYLNESYRDTNGTIRYKQGTYVLGNKTKDDLPTKASAQKRWESQRDSVIQRERRSDSENVLDPSFQTFLNEEFIPIRKGGWNKATREKLSYFFNLLCSEFGTTRMLELDKRTLQSFLNRISERLCHDTVSGCYIYLKAIFGEAAEQKVISESPAKRLSMPHTRDRDTYTVSSEDVMRIENALGGRDRVIFKLLSRCGPTAGEAFAVKWQDLQTDQSLRIRQTYPLGEIKPPKTKKSRNPIYLPRSLYTDLLKLKGEAEDSSPSAWIFPAQRKRRRRLPSGELAEASDRMPMDYHNWVNRNLKPVADKLKIRVNCQIMRRTFATLTNEAGGDLKDIQAQMRHSRSGTTADIYVQPIPRSVRESVEALDLSLSTKPRSKR